MKFLAVAALLLTTTPALAQGTDQDGSWSWCVAEATSPGGKLRYFSDPFEGDAGGDISRVYVEYLTQAYTARDRAGGFAVTCHTDDGLAASTASLKAAQTAKPGVRDVTTGWRFHFE